MGWEIIFSAQSRRDLEKIVAYIAQDNSAAAIRFGSLLIDKAEALANAPEAGPFLPKQSRARFLPVGSYLIIYRVDRERQSVRILRFWHAARRARPER